MAGEQKQGVEQVDVDALVRLAREAKERAERATKGPWSAEPDRIHPEWTIVCRSGEHPSRTNGAAIADLRTCVVSSGGARAYNAAFIAASRADVPTLVDGVLAMAGELRHLRLIKRIFDRDITFGPFDKDADGVVSLPVQDASRVGAYVFGAMAGLLEGMGEGGVHAQNYITMSGWHPSTGRIECTIQRVGKLSPHEARGQAESHLARAVELLKVNGIAWDGPTTFLPDSPPEKKMAPAVGDHMWLTLNPLVQPNTLDCSRCGASQPMPETGTAAVLQAMIFAFREGHADCEEGDAEVARMTAAKWTEDGDR
jgi:hypothetical protein